MNLQYEKKPTNPEGTCQACDRQLDPETLEARKDTETWHLRFGKDATWLLRLCDECVLGLMQTCLDIFGKEATQDMFEGWCQGCRTWVLNPFRHDSVHKTETPVSGTDEVESRICGPVTNFRFAGRGLK